MQVSLSNRVKGVNLSHDVVERKGEFLPIEFVRAKRKTLINWSFEHVHIILFYFLLKRLWKNPRQNWRKSFQFFSVTFMLKKYEPIKMFKGIVRSFHQKNRKKFFSWLQFIRYKTLHQRCHFMKKWIETIQYWKSWRYPFFTLLKFNKSHLIFL